VPDGRRVPGVVAVLIVVATTVLFVLAPVPASAHPGDGVAVLAAPVTSLSQVIENLRAWLMGIIAAIASLYLVLAGVYWATAGGDPGQVDKAKTAFRNALIGYGLTVLAPIFLRVLQGIVGG
jgi:hypothetical protein